MRLTASIIRAAPTSASRRRGMGFLTGHGDLVPALALRPGHDADRQPGGFEDRPLLDMRLEIGFDRTVADRPGSGKADAAEFAAERQVGRVIVAGRQRLVEREN